MNTNIIYPGNFFLQAIFFFKNFRKFWNVFVKIWNVSQISSVSKLKITFQIETLRFKIVAQRFKLWWQRFKMCPTRFKIGTEVSVVAKINKSRQRTCKRKERVRSMWNYSNHGANTKKRTVQEPMQVFYQPSSSSFWGVSSRAST